MKAQYVNSCNTLATTVLALPLLVDLFLFPVTTVLTSSCCVGEERGSSGGTPSGSVPSVVAADSCLTFCTSYSMINHNIHVHVHVCT